MGSEEPRRLDLRPRVEEALSEAAGRVLLSRAFEGCSLSFVGEALPPFATTGRVQVDFSVLTL